MILPCSKRIQHLADPLKKELFARIVLTYVDLLSVVGECLILKCKILPTAVQYNFFFLNGQCNLLLLVK